MADMAAAEEALERYFGYAAFRPGQDTLVKAILAGRDALGIMPTGAGKSVCYQVPAMLMPGITLVISPLISLMKDQVSALKAAGIPGAYLNSTLTQAQYALALERMKAGAYRIIYVSPERLALQGFRGAVAGLDIAMVAVDEAHCISQWGQDFRPEYLRIGEFVDSLSRRPVVSAFTATATPRVASDIRERLGLRDPVLVRTGFDRPNLTFSVLQPEDKDAWILQYLHAHREESGIIYCATRKQVEALHQLLVRYRFPAVRYHAGLSDEERRQNQEDFSRDVRPIAVATNAFGMGIDKSNVSYVIHYQMPLSMEAYYQEAGRAGRDGSPAECVLLYSAKDIPLCRFLIQHGEVNPALTPEEARQLRALDEQRLQGMIAYAQRTDCLRASILRYFGETDVPERCENCSNCMGRRRTERTGTVPGQGKKRASRKIKRMPTVEDELFALLRQKRLELANNARVPAFIIFTDATLREMAQKQPKTREQMLRVNGVGLEKLNRYGDDFLRVIADWRNKPGADGLPANKKHKENNAES